jgi:hypothetical protein
MIAQNGDFYKINKNAAFGVNAASENGANYFLSEGATRGASRTERIALRKP